MRTTLLALTLLAAAAPAAWSAEPSSNAAKELHQLFGSEWERGLRENPVRASHLGDRRYDDRWPDLSSEALARSHAGIAKCSKALRAFPTTRSPPTTA